MAFRRSVVQSRVSPLFRVFWLHARTPGWLDDMTAAGRLADADLVGFVGSAVGVATIADADSVGVSVEQWNRRPLLLDEEPFVYVVEGRVEFGNGEWCMDEAHDGHVQAGLPLHEGPGTYGVRVTAYGRQQVVELMEDHGADYLAAMRAVRALPPAESERYRIQLWPQG